jgi:hypothetical protein
MKSYKVSFFVACMTIFCQCALAQGVVNYTPLISANKTTLCEKDTLFMTIDYGYPNPGAPINATPIIMQNRTYSPFSSTCPYSANYPNYYFNVSDVSPVVSGDGVLSVNVTKTGNDCTGPNYSIKIKAKPSNSSVYRVQWQAVYSFSNRPWLPLPNSSSTTYNYDGSIIVTVIQLPKPSIKANKALVLPNESAVLTASPTAPPGAIYRWKEDCQSNGFFNMAGNPLNVGPGIYRARSEMSGCASEPSEPLSILRETPSPPTLGCNNVTAKQIYDSTRQGDGGGQDYHHYGTVTVICQTGSGNPGCTVDAVWAKLKANVWNNAPLAGDLVPGVGSKLPVLFSKALFDFSDRQTANCGAANLPDPAGVFISLYMMGRFGPLYSNSLSAAMQQVVPNWPFANPIVQTVDEATKTITNYTQNGHILNYGRIVRTVVLECGQVKIKTVGVGTSWAGNNWLGDALGAINSAWGKKIFSNVDQRVKAGF